MRIAQNATVLFQGDSITDAGRDQDAFDDMGRGYAMIASALYSARMPGKRVRFLNRGISGNRTGDLLDRWQEDCIALAPDVISILIGVNDTWRAVDSDDPTSVEEFQQNYTELLTQTIEELARPHLVLLEPFVLANHVRYGTMREDLNPKIEVIRHLAREFEAAFIPLDGLFQQASTTVPEEHWSNDGVHLTPAGHALVAEAWLRAVK